MQQLHLLSIVIVTVSRTGHLTGSSYVEVSSSSVMAANVDIIKAVVKDFWSANTNIIVY